MCDLPATSSSGVLEVIRKDLGRFEGEPHLRLNVKDHYSNLMQLAASLQRLGLDEVVVDGHILGVFNEYREKLLEQVKIMAPTARPTLDGPNG